MFNPLSVITSRGNLHSLGRLFWPRHLILTLSLGAALGLSGCQEPSPPSPPIAVSILPQAYFVDKIMGSQGQVTVMIEPGSDPHSYEPSPQQLQTLGQARAYVKVGLGFEKGWLDKFKSVNPNLVVIDSSEGITPLKEVAHSHEDEHKHLTTNGETLDPHIWLAPPLVKRQAENIYQGLAQINPAQAPTYEINLKKFLAEIDQLDQQIRQQLGPLKNSKFIVFHPAWGYFAQTYHLKQIPIEVQGQEPSAQELAQVIKIAQAENIRVIFAQPQFSAKSAQTIAAQMQGKVIFIDDLAPHWADNLRSVAQTLAQTLKVNSP